MTQTPHQEWKIYTVTLRVGSEVSNASQGSSANICTLRTSLFSGEHYCQPVTLLPDACNRIGIAIVRREWGKAEVIFYCAQDAVVRIALA